MGKSPVMPVHIKKFADAYLATHNGSEAVRQAGSRAKYPSVQANKWLKRPDVKQYMARRIAEEQPMERLGDQVIKELKTLAFSNIADLISIDANGQPSFDLSNATREQLAAITALKTKETKRYDSKGAHIATDKELALSLVDKQRGLELLGKHAGLFKADEQRIVIDIADRLLTARRRVALLGADSGITWDSEQGGGGAPV